MAKEQEQQTMEEYLLSQLDTPVVLNWRSSESRAKPRLSYAESRRKWAKAKDGTMMTKPDGSPMTKQEAIATNILNLAMNRRSSESRAKRLAAWAMPSRDGGRPKGQGRREGKQSDRFELSRQTGLRRKAKGK